MHNDLITPYKILHSHVSVNNNNYISIAQTNYIRGNWLRNFLSNRTMHVKVKLTLSDPFDQISGIPQGSVLGPLYFILFINDLPAQAKNCIIKLYADDVKLIFRFNKNNWVNKLLEDLNAIANWAKEWQLNVSILKTYMSCIFV